MKLQKCVYVQDHIYLFLCCRSEQLNVLVHAHSSASWYAWLMYDFKVQARYFVDEVKDKCGEDINVDSWEHEFVRELPEQENG